MLSCLIICNQWSFNAGRLYWTKKSEIPAHNSWRLLLVLYKSAELKSWHSEKREVLWLEFAILSSLAERGSRKYALHVRITALLSQDLAMAKGKWRSAPDSNLWLS